MKVLIWADVEGASCVDDYRQIASVFGQFFDEGRRYITSDVNAAIRGVKKAGATEIDIFDGHGSGGTLVQEQLEAGCNLLGGGLKILEMVKSKAIASYDALILVGQHSSAGTTDGFLSHTHSPEIAIKINGMHIGEIEEIAWMFGYFDVPTIMIAGDAAAIKESKSFFPNIEGVSVKTATERHKVECLPLTVTQQQIEDAAFNALGKLKNTNTYKIIPPIEFDITFSSEEAASLAAISPMFKLKDPKTISYISNDYIEALLTFFYATSIISIINYQKIINSLWYINEAREVIENFERNTLKQWATEPTPFEPIKR